MPRLFSDVVYRQVIRRRLPRYLCGAAVDVHASQIISTSTRALVIAHRRPVPGSPGGLDAGTNARNVSCSNDQILEARTIAPTDYSTTYVSHNALFNYWMLNLRFYKIIVFVPPAYLLMLRQ